MAAITQYPEHDLSQFPSELKGKRVLLCTESFGPVNGVSRTTLMLVTHLRNHGAQVAVVAPHNHTNHNTFSPPPSPNLGPMDKQPEVRVTGYPLPFNPELSVVYPVRNSTLYSKTFGSDELPDIIYLASPASLGFQVMLQLRQQAEENQIPIICNFQTDLAGYCAILFPAPFSHLAVFAFAAVQSYLFRHSSIKTIFYPSQFVKRYLVSQNVQAEKLSLLTRGVNTELFNPTCRDNDLRAELAPNGEIIFMTVCRIAGEKGFDFLAKAASEFDARGLPFKMVIVGGNRNPDVEKEVQDLFEDQIEKGNVLFTGFKHGDELAKYYASADIFLHCSITETFGLVVLESMASGVPVIARDEGGPSDIINHGKTGFLVPPHDIDSFVAKATMLTNDKAMRAQMVIDARAAACECTWDKINNKVAWRMADCITERAVEQERLKEQPRAVLPSAAAAGAKDLVPVYGWLMMNSAMRETILQRIVDARLVGGLGIICSFWIVTGAYMVFIEAAMWAKGRFRGERRPSISA
ncbi:Putative Glycosyltransferase family 4 [[Torrubiella] hemipterigena]|uniref:Putative Glycosyltransferase family 4 n=1 Tax=[Torrubiella] hemipterigena TaxID=1531966 RepID=A0A0A1SPZ2_9HYPO|nr:Putative Glycosyltransferase family 4 [[Torrubiella] hemipterigena]